MFSPYFDQLVSSLRHLPSVGPKSAQRMALQILLKQRQSGLELALALQQAIENVHHCAQCQSLTENEFCDICLSKERDTQVLCVVESPADVLAIEQSGSFNGKYHVLTGHLSPLDGIGAEEIGIPLLLHRLENEAVEELIIATNPTIEGQATAHYLAHAVQHLSVNVTRIAQGVPQGGELGYVDSHTLNQAFQHRRSLKE